MVSWPDPLFSGGSEQSPHDLVGLLGLIGTDLHPDQDLPATLHQAAIAAKQLFEADAAGVMLVDLDGTLRWASASDQRAQTLEDNQEVFAAGPCMQALTSGRPAVMHDATLERRWEEIALVFVEVHIRSGLSVPVDLGGGPIGTLGRVRGRPAGLGRQRGNRPAAYAGVVASLLSAAAKAHLRGRWPTSSRPRWTPGA